LSSALKNSAISVATRGFEGGISHKQDQYRAGRYFIHPAISLPGFSRAAADSRPLATALHHHVADHPHNNIWQNQLKQVMRWKKQNQYRAA